MILSPCRRTPPFRPPVLKSANDSATAQGPSHGRQDAAMKKTHVIGQRKRDSIMNLEIPLYDACQELDDNMTGSSSPRSAVAERLGDLDLHQQRPGESQNSPKKRIRDQGMICSQPVDAAAVRNHTDINTTLQNDESPLVTAKRFAPSTPPSRKKFVSHVIATPNPTEIDVPESVENSVIHVGRRIVVPETPPSSPLTQVSRHQGEQSARSIDKDDSHSNHDADQSMLNHADTDHIPLAQRQILIDRGVFLERRDRMDEDGVDQAALTWQDDEITGYIVDPSIPDDDGEGINGIGFRPTPHEAYARSQKRRKQVNDWRAREAREAREKRISRRRGTLLDETFLRSRKKRVVRFVGDE